MKRPTLEQLEHDDWGDPPRDATQLIATVHRLRRTPVADLTVENLRMLIAQQVGLPFLVPRALDVLEADPLAEGHFHPGDLRAAVSRLGDDYWSAHPADHARLRALPDVRED